MAKSQTFEKFRIVRCLINENKFLKTAKIHGIFLYFSLWNVLATAASPKFFFLNPDYNLTSVCILSMLFSIFIVRFCQGEFVFNSNAFL